MKSKVKVTEIQYLCVGIIKLKIWSAEDTIPSLRATYAQFNSDHVSSPPQKTNP